MFLPPLKASIGAKMFGAFIAMGLMTGLLGLYGFYVLVQTGSIVADSYDGPLMATNYARAASIDFVEMDRDELRRLVASEEEDRAILDEIKHLASSFEDDLKVAEDRSQAEDERAIIREIRALAAQWNDARHDGARATGSDTDLLSAKILARFDTLTELIADHSFVARRQALSAIDSFRTSGIAALAAALGTAAIITFFLRRRITRPLAAAAAVADRIAHGELETPIPDGGSDETGILLGSMRVMQNNIRLMVERETAQRRSAQNRLIDALESSREGMVLVGSDGRIVLVNSEFARFFPDMTGTAVAGADFAETFRAQYPDLIDPISAGGEFQLGDGRWLRSSRSPTQDGGCFLFLSDFTAIKEREETFKEAKRQAEAASKAKSAFLANMSHELKTPLNAIIGFSDVINNELMGPLGNPDYKEYIAHIRKSGGNLLEIIDSVLELSKSETFQLSLEIGTVNLGRLLADCVAAIRPQCEQAGLDFSASLPEGDLRLPGDGAKLRRIFLNLLSNAAKFTERGGRIRLAARIRADQTIEIEIADTGIGIAAEDIPLALAPFGQVDSRLARQYEGIGLGLPLSQVLVELHGGRLKIDSAVGKGTTVTVVLPRDIRQHASQAA